MSLNLNTILKAVKLSVSFLFLPLFFFGQTLTGLWTGTLKNNGDTIRKDQSFEIALTEYKGKVYGYSRSEFIINDTLYYILKRVKGIITGDSCEVKDDEILSYNFRGKLDKGVKVISVFHMNKKDSTWHLDGNWKTTKTKHFYSITGKIKLQEQKDFSQSALFPDLEELNLAKNVAFYQEQKQKNELVSKEQSSESKDLIAATDKKISEQTKISESSSNNKKSTLTNAISETPKKQSEIISSLSESKNIKPVIDKKKTDSLLVKNLSVKKELPEEQFSQSKDLVISNNKKQETGKISITADKDSTSLSSISVTTKKQLQIISALPESKKNQPVFETKKERPAVQIANSNDLVTVNNKKQVEVKKSLLVDKDSVALSSISATTKMQPQINSSLSESKKVNPVSENKGTDSMLVKTDTRKKEPSVSINSSEIKKDNTSEITVKNKMKPADLGINNAAAFATERKSEISQIVNFKSDSLELVLYDNGEVDGDTVSVLLNNRVIIAKQGLLAVAYKKKIYIPENAGDSIVLTLYAENLGKYPPNTGLLIIHDGDDSYQVHFTADLQTNASVILKRKRSQ